MNNPEGYVLVQVKQLAQWREWANNVAAWSTKADRSSEGARLKASISSAMISATQPTASNAGEREIHSNRDAYNAGYEDALQTAGVSVLVGHHHTPAALASKPVAPPAREAMQAALEKIARWIGQFPSTGRFHDNGEPQSYAYCFGSNGERDYMRSVASAALSATTPAPAEQTDTERLDAMQAHRIAVVPEFEGPWDAEVYGEEGEPLARGSGNTPREAIDNAIRSARGADGGGL